MITRCPPKVHDVMSMMILRKELEWYAFALSQFEIIGTESVPRMGLTIDPVNIIPRILVNPKWVDSLPVGEIIAVLCHELWHFLNMTFARQQLRDEERWNFSTDAAINWNITSDMSKGQLGRMIKLPDDCIKLPANVPQTEIYSEYIYDLVPDNQGNQKTSGCGFESVNTQADKTLSNGVGDQWNKFTKGEVVLVDDHSLFGDFNDIPDEILKHATTRMIQESSKMAGHTPNGAEDILKRLLESKIPWRTLLRSFVGNNIKIGSRASWTRRNRRFGSTQPGRIVKRGGKCVVLIDTSGSTSNEQEQFWGEVDQIARLWDVWVVQCDADVQGQPEKYRRGMEIKVRGYGGTNMNPGLKKCLELRPDVIVVLTDGYLGQVPTETKVPELWIISKDGIELAGKRCIKIEDD